MMIMEERRWPKIMWDWEPEKRSFEENLLYEEVKEGWKRLVFGDDI